MFSGCVTVITALLFSHAFAHSRMTWPEPISPGTCRVGGEPQFGVLNCPGPCDISAIKDGSANFGSPRNPATTFRRGQTYSIKYQRNNHPPGGFVRLTMVSPSKMMDKKEHDKNAFYYSCWGANAVKATPGELREQRYSITGSDGKHHDLPPGYYTTNVKIPAVIPDGDYVLGWAWYGGTGGGKVENNGPAKVKPAPWGYFSDYWACSFVKVQGGAPLAAKHTPVFNNDMRQFSSEGCMSANDALEVCSSEPCKVTGKYQKPREFKNGKTPRPLTPQDFRGFTPKSPSNVNRPTQPRTQPPTAGRRSCRCIAQGGKCWKWLAEGTNNRCRAYTGSYNQPSMCKEMCCSHCENRRGTRLCRNQAVMNVCGM